MKHIYMYLVCGLLPVMLFSQQAQTGLTLIPDSVYCDDLGIQTIYLANATSEPINILSVQQSCIGCTGGAWWTVYGMSFAPPHYLYPGQWDTVKFYISTICKNSSGPASTYFHSTMEIQSSAGTQYCHIFINSGVVQGTDEKTGKEVAVYPNPSSSIINLNLPESTQPEVSVEIFNSAGRIVYADVIENRHLSINVESLLRGLYLVRVQAGSKLWSMRWIKE